MSEYAYRLLLSTRDFILSSNRINIHDRYVYEFHRFHTKTSIGWCKIVGPHSIILFDWKETSPQLIRWHRYLQKWWVNICLFSFEYFLGKFHLHFQYWIECFWRCIVFFWQVCMMTYSKIVNSVHLPVVIPFLDYICLKKSKFSETYAMMMKVISWVCLPVTMNQTETTNHQHPMESKHLSFSIRIDSSNCIDICWTHVFFFLIKLLC